MMPVFWGDICRDGGIDKKQPSSLFHLGIRLKINAFDGKLGGIWLNMLEIEAWKGSITFPTKNWQTAQTATFSNRGILISEI